MVQKSSRKIRILVLMKRFGANKDMVIADFGRQIRLFENFSSKYEIDFYVPDYKKREKKDMVLHGMNFFVRPYSLLSHFSFLWELHALVKKNKYDCIVGTTDPLLGILAVRLGKRYGMVSVYDMQDEYSSYSSSKIPMVSFFDKGALKNSDIVMTVSDSLASRIRKFRKGPILTVQNGIDARDFKKSSKEKARRHLKLPKGKIVVYTGEISRFKGVDVLIKAFSHVKKEIPGAKLLLSGRVKDVDITGQDIIYRKFGKREHLILALKAADVGVIPNVDNVFSRYCFPYKAVEYMAAGLHIVATDIGDMHNILLEFPDSLCAPGDEYSMAKCITRKLVSDEKPNYRRILSGLTWKRLSTKIDLVMRKSVKR